MNLLFNKKYLNSLTLKNSFFVAVLLQYLFLSASAFSADPAEEDYNFSWLDPDKKVYVLQNRRYRKAMRPYIVANGGMNLSNPFRDSYLGGGRAGFWINEQFGVEGLMAFASNSENSTMTAIRSQTTVLPYVREIRSYYAGMVNWAPFYAKLNFFNYVLYFDWMIHAGLGQVNTANDRNRVSTAASSYTNENHLGIFFGTGINFFLSKHFSIRLDLQGVNFGATGADDKDKRFQNFDFTGGLGFML